MLVSTALEQELSSVWLIRALLSRVIFFQYSAGYWEGSIFNLLIALVFGFSTLNILGLVTRPFEQRRDRLSVGEILALTAMALSVCFLAGEMLEVFHVFPIKLEH